MDNKKLKGKNDDVKIDSHDIGELRYAARRFRVTPGAVAVAIHVVGNSRKKVGEWLKENWDRIMSS